LPNKVAQTQGKSNRFQSPTGSTGHLAIAELLNEQCGHALLQSPTGGVQVTQNWNRPYSRSFDRPALHRNTLASNSKLE